MKYLLEALTKGKYITILYKTFATEYFINWNLYMIKQNIKFYHIYDVGLSSKHNYSN